MDSKLEGTARPNESRTDVPDSPRNGIPRGSPLGVINVYSYVAMLENLLHVLADEELETDLKNDVAQEVMNAFEMERSGAIHI